MKIALRPAHDQDYDFCAHLYFSGMANILRELNIDVVAHAAGFREQWRSTEVRIIHVDGDDLGWLQTIDRGGELFLGQLFVDAPFQNRGIGTEVMRMVMDECAQAGLPITLGVVKTNPASRLYERLGFRITGEDDRKFYMQYHQVATG